MKKTIPILITILIIMTIWFFSYEKITYKPNRPPIQNSQPLVSATTTIDSVQSAEPTVSAFEKGLLHTAWVQIDEQGNATDEEYVFGNTKDNDPTHTYYDFNEYLHQRPGEIGYWKIDNNNLTIIGSPSDIPPTVYTIIKITDTVLVLLDDGTPVTFTKIKAAN